MNDQLLGIFKIFLLVLLYLFFARVLWAVWNELRRTTTAPPGAPGAPAAASAPAPGSSPDPAGQPKAPKPGRVSQRRATTPAPTPPPAAVPAPSGPTPRPTKGKRGGIGRLVVIEPKSLKGTAYAVTDEITLGRAPGCTVSIPDDTFISQLHARVFRQSGQVFVEDLGSTNGSFLNGKRLSIALRLNKGDRLQVGTTVLEAE